MREGGRLGVVDAGEELGVLALLRGADGGLAVVGGALQLQLHIGSVLFPQRDGVVALVIGHHDQRLAVRRGDGLAILVQYQQLGAGGAALIGVALVVLVGVDEQLADQRGVGVFGAEVGHGGDGFAAPNHCQDGSARDRQAVLWQFEADLVAAGSHIEEVILASLVGQGIRLLERVPDTVFVGVGEGLAGVEYAVAVGVVETLRQVEHTVVVGVEVDGQPCIGDGRADVVGNQGLAGQLHRGDKAVKAAEGSRVDAVVDLEVGPLGRGGHPLLAPGDAAGAPLEVFQREVGRGIPQGAVGVGECGGNAWTQRGQLGAGIHRVIGAAVDGPLRGLHSAHIVWQCGQF